jgi:ribosomal protein S18 acetylase RimI-like enzyme
MRAQAALPHAIIAWSGRVSKQLMNAILARARSLGYAEMLLDTLRSMTAARRLYSSYGFTEIESYYQSVDDAVFYKLIL